MEDDSFASSYNDVIFMK